VPSVKDVSTREHHERMERAFTLSETIY